MKRHKSFHHSKDRDAVSGYTNGKRLMPTEGEDRYESVYRNPVGAQSGAPLEGQHQVNRDSQLAARDSRTVNGGR
jgi:hypothetical protein